jgi:glycosyltransferase involved in cell wall biosynthesis
VNSSEPFVTVVTPVYNNGPFIAECIESVLNQNYSNFEYLIVNNCSTDDTLEIAQRYAARDHRIRVKTNPEFLGVIANHNNAFNQMSPKSKYCKVVSGDDWIFPECLSRMVELAEAHPSAGIVGCYSIEGPNVLFQGLDYSETVVNGREISRNVMLGTRPYVLGAPSSLLYRADLVRRTRTFYPWPDPAPHADVSGVYQALLDSDFGFVHQVLSYTRVHVDSQTSKSFKYGRQHHAWMAAVVRFGPELLTPLERKQHLGAVMTRYYAWLIAALVENSFDSEFIESQRAALRLLGFELSAACIVKAALKRGVDFLREPGVTSRKLSVIMKRKGRIEARGYVAVDVGQSVPGEMTRA